MKGLLMYVNAVFFDIRTSVKFPHALSWPVCQQNSIIAFKWAGEQSVPIPVNASRTNNLSWSNQRRILWSRHLTVLLDYANPAHACVASVDPTGGFMWQYGLHRESVMLAKILLNSCVPSGMQKRKTNVVRGFT